MLIITIEPDTNPLKRASVRSSEKLYRAFDSRAFVAGLLLAKLLGGP